MNIGAEALDDNCDYLTVGEMGIGNTTAAAALCLGQFGADATGWVGPGTGLDDDGVNVEQFPKIAAHSLAINERPSMRLILSLHA